MGMPNQVWLIIGGGAIKFAGFFPVMGNATLLSSMGMCGHLNAFF